MSNPAAPPPADPHRRPDEPVSPGVVSDPDVPNRLGPDTPNVRPDDPKLGPNTPLARPPAPPVELLKDDDFAPDAE